MNHDLDHYREGLERALEGVLERPRISVEKTELARILIFVVSPTFEGMDDGERQAILWGAVLDNFDEGDQRRIEFIFTDAPSEIGTSAEPEPTATNPGA